MVPYITRWYFSEVISGAHDCLTPLADKTDHRDVVMPVFSSGQWAGTLPATAQAVPSGDLLFMCGGGILAHPGGAAAGVRSLHQAWQAIREDYDLKPVPRDLPPEGPP